MKIFFSCSLFFSEHGLLVIIVNNHLPFSSVETLGLLPPVVRIAELVELLVMGWMTRVSLDRLPPSQPDQL
jgi:hypothetical protein